MKDSDAKAGPVGCSAWFCDYRTGLRLPEKVTIVEDKEFSGWRVHHADGSESGIGEEWEDGLVVRVSRIDCARAAERHWRLEGWRANAIAEMYSGIIKEEEAASMARFREGIERELDNGGD